MKRLALAAAAVLLAGCPSYTTLGSARTMDRGRFNGYVAPGVVGVIGSKGLTSLEQFEIGGHYALTDSVEIGGKLWLIGFEVDGKFALWRPADADDGFNVSLDPGLGYLGFDFGSAGIDNVSILQVYLPVLIGYRMAGNELIVAPKVIDWLGVGGSSSTNLLFVGSSVGYALRILPWLKVIPELSLSYPLALSNNGAPPTFGSSGVIFQFAVGFSFGRERNSAEMKSTESRDGI